uniref:Prolyl endopeptidase n=1 Tax=Ananas comosus var. bracteatus TaxID=296719 RepID=A0A6V7NLT8_ANACO|nr:unnamed protein product [Ananas comosus var. bracteatus]
MLRLSSSLEASRNPLPLFLLRRLLHRRGTKPRTSPPPPLPPPPTPPKPPQKPVPFTVHGVTWNDPYSWMSSLSDSVAMRHMDVYMEQEEKYAEAAMAAAGADRLVRKLQIEMARASPPSSPLPPCGGGPGSTTAASRRASSTPFSAADPRPSTRSSSPTASPPRASISPPGSGSSRSFSITIKRPSGYSYEELSEVSPDHRYIAYTMYDKDKDSFTLSVRDLTTGTLCDKPRADRVANLSWAMNGQALLYTVTNDDKRPYRVLGSDKNDVLILEEPDENVYVNIRNTKDFRYVTVNIFSDISSKVYLIKSSDPLSGMTLVWECEPHAHCIIEHHRGYLYLFTDAARGGVPVDSHYLLRRNAELSSSNNWESVLEEPGLSVEDVDFCDTHMVLVLREEKRLRLSSVRLPLPMDVKVPARLSALSPCDLPLPDHVCQISPSPNYDYYSSTMRFMISSPVMPDAVVDYNLLNGKWLIVQQQNMLHERTRTLYGNAFSANSKSSVASSEDNVADSWNELAEYYACEYYDVASMNEVLVPLTVVYSKKHKQEGSPGLLHGHGAYGELLDKSWRSELKSLLDRGWVIAYADVRGGGGSGKKWHHDGRRTKKLNSINDYVSCAEFLVEKGMVHENKLAGWGYSAGGLLVASAINTKPDLFRAAILKVPFLDVCNTLLHPILPLTPVDYEEFGYPVDLEDFLAIQKYSPYDNIQKGVPYPAVLVTSSFNTRFGVWEAAKWVARVRELTVYDPKRPIILNLTTDIVEESKYLQSKELALETAFLIKMVEDS